MDTCEMLDERVFQHVIEKKNSELPDGFLLKSIAAVPAPVFC